jgi:hypothetical protein
LHDGALRKAWQPSLKKRRPALKGGTPQMLFTIVDENYRAAVADKNGAR